MRVDALEVRAEAELDHLELGQLGEDAVGAQASGDTLASIWVVSDGFHPRSVPYEHVFV
jgi:hypothetical protein